MRTTPTPFVERCCWWIRLICFYDDATDCQSYIGAVSTSPTCYAKLPHRKNVQHPTNNHAPQWIALTSCALQQVNSIVLYCSSTCDSVIREKRRNRTKQKRQKCDDGDNDDGDGDDDGEAIVCKCKSKQTKIIHAMSSGRSFKVPLNLKSHLLLSPIHTLRSTHRSKSNWNSCS